MQATADQIIALTKIQHLDQQVSLLQKDLDTLPQKAKILEIRQKHAALEKKAAAVVSLERNVETKLGHARAEAQDLDQKSAVAQKAIDESNDDYRSVEVHAKELEGFSQRLEVVNQEIDQATAKLAEIRKVKGDINAMMAAFEKREKELTESYRYEGGMLMQDIAAKGPERAALAEVVGSAIMAHYDRIAKAKQGVALAALNENACNTCRATFDPSRVLGLRAEAPLTICPHCGRLMVVNNSYKG